MLHINMFWPIMVCRVLDKCHRTLINVHDGHGFLLYSGVQNAYKLASWRTEIFVYNVEYTQYIMVGIIIIAPLHNPIQAYQSSKFYI